MGWKKDGHPVPLSNCASGGGQAVWIARGCPFAVDVLLMGAARAGNSWLQARGPSPNPKQHSYLGGFCEQRKSAHYRREKDRRIRMIYSCWVSDALVAQMDGAWCSRCDACVV